MQNELKICAGEAEGSRREWERSTIWVGRNILGILQICNYVGKNTPKLVGKGNLLKLSKVHTTGEMRKNIVRICNKNKTE